MLLDVGVWFTAVWAGHVHHRRVASWFGDQNDQLVLCRVAQMGLLRLLSNAAVMREDVLTRADSWTLLDHLQSDQRVRFAQEPLHIEQVWRAMSARADQSHRLWTDDYLAAFAQAAGLTLVTLDSGFADRYPSVTVRSPL